MTTTPPGPRAPALLQTLRWLGRPIPMLEDCARRYGDAFTIRLSAYPPMVLFSHPWEFFPFGGGTRACLGAAFASFEMKIVLARMLGRVDLRAVPGYRARIVRRGVAFAPSEGMPVVVEGRAA
jgi:cytochrome P450